MAGENESNYKTALARLMPKPVDLGHHMATCMASPMMNLAHWQDGCRSPHGLRTVMGYFLPAWQRGLVWTEAQKISFIESAWKGVPLGTFTYNVVYDEDHPLDNLLIDGQQRMSAIESYISDEFPVLGYRWSELTKLDKRRWDMSVMFPSYRTETRDEAYLRSYYNLMNFGGTAHKLEERA